MLSFRVPCGLALLGSALGLRRSSNRETATSDLADTRDCYSKYDGMTLMQLAPCTPVVAVRVLAELRESGCDLLGDSDQLAQLGCADAEMVCSPEVAAPLVKRKLATVISTDAGALWRNTSGLTQTFAEGFGTASDFYTTWRDLDTLMARVESIVQNSGGIATLETAGKSLEGRDMKIVRFRGPGYSPGGTRVIAVFNIHAREWITGMSGVYAVEQLVAKVQQDPNYLAGTEVVYMPMANPDGFAHSVTNDRMHRKNMRNVSARCIGVDLVRNWDSHWASGGSSDDPCQDIYHGTAPNSEPEVKVIAQLMKESKTTMYIDIHSFGQMVLSAYGWTAEPHPRAAEYHDVRAMIYTAITTAEGNNLIGSDWKNGPIGSTLYPASGGSVDYASDLGALGIVFELRPQRMLGGGFSPPTGDILPAARECQAGLLAAIDYAKAPGPPPSTTTPPGQCPWHGCVVGCLVLPTCKFCDRCRN